MIDKAQNISEQGEVNEAALITAFDGRSCCSKLAREAAAGLLDISTAAGIDQASGVKRSEERLGIG